jgi:hypothetical protein
MQQMPKSGTHGRLCFTFLNVSHLDGGVGVVGLYTNSSTACVDRLLVRTSQLCALVTAHADHVDIEVQLWNAPLLSSCNLWSVNFREQRLRRLITTYPNIFRNMQPIPISISLGVSSYYEEFSGGSPRSLSWTSGLPCRDSSCYYNHIAA